MKSILALAIGLAITFSPVVAAGQGHSGHASPYAGLENREIKSLSEADIEELLRGAGWGLALAAELNGVPGPAHLLELRDEIPLTADQVVSIQTILAEMRAEAIAVGARLIEAEEAIEAAFRAGALDNARLRSLIDEAETARAELRFIHLSRHLTTPPLLTEEQIARYSQLRGYESNPCTNVPEGHDAEVWRRHRGCA
jgi:hypothetical protein